MEILLETYYKKQDGNDWSPAFDRAVKAFKPTTSGTSNARGFTLRFEPKEYFFSKSMHLTIPLHLLGSGTIPHSGTVLKFPKGEKGIIVHHQNTDMYETYGKGAPKTGGSSQGTIIEKLTLAAGQPTTLAIPTPMLDFEESGIHPHTGAHGITIYSFAVVRDVYIKNFDGHGIYIFGVTESDFLHPEVISVADIWQLTNVMVERCGGDGLHIYGTDAHNGIAIACQFIHNIGWGICDLSQLGTNTFLTGQSSYNITGGVYRPYMVTNRSYGTLAQILKNKLQRNPKLDANAYQVILNDLTRFKKEWENPPLSDFPSLSTTNLDTPEFWLIYRKYTDAVLERRKTISQRLQNALEKANIKQDFSLETTLDICVPFAMGTSVFSSFYAESNGTDATERNEVGVINFCFNTPSIKNSTKASAFDMAGFHNTFKNTINATDGLMLNGGTLMQSADAKPVGAIFPIGTIVLNQKPVNGGSIGWIYTANSQWKEFGKIDA
jgi:hypothetical protein